MTVHLVARPALAVVMDLGPLSIHLGVWEREGCYGTYHGQFHFLGQLSKPLAIIGDGGVAEWVRLNPRGEIVTYHRRVPARARPDFVQLFRAMTIGVWDAGPGGNRPHLGQAAGIARPFLDSGHNGPHILGTR